MSQRVGPSPVADAVFYSATFHAKPSKRLHRLVATAFLLVPLPGLIAQTATPVPVLTWRYDLTHAGQNTQETALTPANVNPQTFGKLFSLPVDSTVYAQPLYVPGLKMSDGLVHNVLIVATENDSIYAFDADSNSGANAKPIWQVSLLTTAYGASAGATAVPWTDTGSPDVAPTVGITGTPAINPATNTMYLVANTKESGAYFSRLHAINITNGTEQPNSPVNIVATAAGTGAGSSGGQITFSALWENQRTALNYYNGYVYFAYSAHGDLNNWHGWLFAYNASTLTQSAALCLTPDDIGGGVWGSGAGMPIDTNIAGGRMFIVTGNGARSNPPFNASTDFGQSVVAFNLANGALTPTDSFTSFNYLTLNTEDWDQGAGGALMLPDQPGSYPHLLITAGKEGRITVLNRDNLGGYASGASSNTNALQDISGLITQGQGFWSTAAYWNGNVYVWAGGDNPGTPNAGMQFKLNNGVMDTTPDSESTVTSKFPGPTFSVSSNGTQNGIAWAVRADQFNTNGAAVLYAFDATDLSKILFESDTNATRDSAGPANKFSVPVVTNGKVYIAADGEVDVYGLLNVEASAATPVINPNGGSFSTSQSVQITCSTASASIFYTLDGSTPTTSSTAYTTPITISVDTTIKAIATAPGYSQSAVGSATFTFTNQTPPVTINPAAGTYGSAQSVTLTDADANAKIYYTTDGSAPSSSSTLYTGPIQVSVSQTINAVAIDPALENSNVATAAYVIQSGGSSINFGNGFSSTAGLTLNGSAVVDSQGNLDLTNGGLSQAGSIFWNAPINVQAFTTTFEFKLSNAQANGFTFTIQNMGTTALGGNSAGLGYQDIQRSVAVKFNFYNYQNEGSDSTGVYTDGQPPVIPTVDISPSGVVLGSGDAIQAKISYDGTTLTLKLLDLATNNTFTASQAISIPQVVGGNTAYVGFTGSTGGLSATQALLSWTFTAQAVPPTFAPPAGTYNAAQNVTLSSATSDAVLYYTTDGSAPSASSNKYSSPIAVASSETINAVAISPTLRTSNTVSAAYVIQSGTMQTVPPTFAPPAGTYNAAQNVTLSSATSDAVLYYTTDGSAPSASSNKYSSPIAVASSETINAVAISPTLGTSNTVSAAYVIQSGTMQTVPPTFAPPAGTYNAAQNVALSSATSDAVLYYTTDGSAPSASSNKYSSPIAVASSETINAVAISPTLGTSNTVSAAYVIQVATSQPSFTVTGGTSPAVSAGGSTTTTITVTPSGGFTGTVTLACAIGSVPTGAVYPPVCSVSQPPAISGTQAVTASLTITTTGPTPSAALPQPLRPIFKVGEGTFLAIVIFCLPFRRRKWATMFGLLLLATLAAVVSGCGNDQKVIAQHGGSTTAGSYTVTVTGTSGTLQSSANVALTVQ